MTKIDKIRAIPKEKLVEGRWYLGCGRGSNVAQWTRFGFAYPDRKYNEIVLKFCDYYDGINGFGCFMPVKMIKDFELPTIHEYVHYKENIQCQMKHSKKSK